MLCHAASRIGELHEHLQHVRRKDGLSARSGHAAGANAETAGRCGRIEAKGLNISLDDSCLCATCRGEKNATEGKPEWFNELKWTIAGRKIEVRPSDVEVLTAFISGRRFLEYDDYKEPVKRYLLRLKELLAGYSDKKENRK